MSPTPDPLNRIEAELKSLQPRQPSARMSKAIARRIQPEPVAAGGWFSWRHAGLKPALAAAALVVLAGMAIYHFPRRNQQVIVKLPGTESLNPPEVSLTSGWRIKPARLATYQVLKPDLVRLDRGELFVESAPLPTATATRSPLKIETPAGSATAKGTRFFIGTHAVESNNPKENTEMTNQMNQLTRVLVLTGMVTLANAHGETTGKADNLLVAGAGKAPVNHSITANGSFAANLYAALAKENPGKNLFFSPYSMSSALAMTAEGARKETADQMGKVLGFPQDARHIGDDAQLLPWNTALIHTGMSALNEQFKPKPVPAEVRDTIARLRVELEASRKQEGVLSSTAPGQPTWEDYYRRCNEQKTKSQKLVDEINALAAQVDQYELRVANALYGEKTYPFQQAYLDTINKYYGTGAVVPVDFIHNFEAVRGQINTFVEKQTNQRIKDLIGAGGLDKDTRLVLVNAIYFKGEWAMPFDAWNTKNEDFLAGAERKISVPMMRKDKMDGARYGAFNANGSFFKTPQRVSAHTAPDPKMLYPGKDGFVVAELPYKGKELSMMVLVPQDVGGLGALESKLTSANLQTWLGKLEGREVNVQLPKFKLETDYQKMGDTLKAMGMVRAFTDPTFPNGAQFDGMCASSDPMLKLYITKVCHKAFVEVNEKGTEAAAATAVHMDAPSSMPRDKPFTPTFRADKPFVFAIRDVKTGTILFLGRVMDPTK